MEAIEAVGLETESVETAGDPAGDPAGGLESTYNGTDVNFNGEQ